MGRALYIPGELIPLPLSGSIPELPHVAKVENRTTPKISRKQISRQLYRCNAPHRRCEGLWSFSWETMRTLTSPYTKRISSPRKFRSSPQKDFCNNIDQQETHAQQQFHSLSRRHVTRRPALPHDAVSAYTGRVN